MRFYRGSSNMPAWSGQCAVVPFNPEFQVDGSGSGEFPSMPFAATLQESYAIDCGKATWTVTNLGAQTIPFLLFRFGKPTGEPYPQGLPLDPHPWGDFQGQEERWKKFGWPWTRQVPCAVWRTPYASFSAHFTGRMEDASLFCQDSEPIGIIEARIPPGETREYSIQLRASGPGVALSEVLRGCREEWALTRPGLNYDPDVRHVLHWIRATRSLASVSNPYGFHDWRPDLNEPAADAWAAGIANAALLRGFQGAIAHGGEAGFALVPWNVSGQPADVADLDGPAWGWYRRCFRDNFALCGLRSGGAMRLGLVPGDQLAMRMQRAGELIYVDSRLDESGAPDIRTMASRVADARQKIGRDPQVWHECPHLLTVRDMGIYAHLGPNRSLDMVTQAMRAFYPDAGILANEVNPASFAEYATWCEDRGYAAYVEDWRVGEVAATGG